MLIITDYRISGLTFRKIIQEQSKREPIFAKLFATITPTYQSQEEMTFYKKKAGSEVVQGISKLILKRFNIKYHKKI